jgi:hypothetical protein
MISCLHLIFCFVFTSDQDPNPDPHSLSKLDPDPHSLKKLDPEPDTDPHKVNADPKHCRDYLPYVGPA